MNKLGRARPGCGRDDGFTLANVLVAVVIMAVFVAMVTASMTVLRRSVASTQALSLVASNADDTFGLLRNQVSNALSMTEPAVVDHKWYIEWSSVTPGVADCVQTRVGDGLIEQRTWNVTDHKRVNLTDWNIIASGVDSIGDQDVFTFTAPDKTTRHQHLTVRLSFRDSTTSGPVSTDVVEDFVATHTRIDTPLNTLCTGGRP